jgi:hypothetical protein
MKEFAIAIAAVGTLTATALGFAGATAAAPTGGSSAADTVKALEDQGYNVQLNGIPDVPLSQCTVTGVHGLRGSNIDSAGRPIDPRQLNTVYVDIACHPYTS